MFHMSSSPTNKHPEEGLSPTYKSHLQVPPTSPRSRTETHLQVPPTSPPEVAPSPNYRFKSYSAQAPEGGWSKEL